MIRVRVNNRLIKKLKRKAEEYNVDRSFNKQ